jgi:YfiH family protein
MAMPQPLLAESLAGIGGLAHGFFTRRGGVSEGIYASLNCGLGSRDDPAAVRENRARVAAHLGARELVSAHQVHGTAALVVARPWPAQGRPKADAMVTATRGLALSVLAADCAPVLLAEPDAGIVGAAHAGWRGALAGVLEAAVEAMVGLGGTRARIRAAVGPCIGQDAYEVGPEFEAAFLAGDAASARFFARGGAGARPRFDLPGYVADRLQRAGVAATARTAACTCAGGGDFFSYRRSRARGEADYGRQISAILLT